MRKRKERSIKPVDARPIYELRNLMIELSTFLRTRKNGEINVYEISLKRRFIIREEIKRKRIKRKEK